MGGIDNLNRLTSIFPTENQASGIIARINSYKTLHPEPDILQREMFMLDKMILASQVYMIL